MGERETSTRYAKRAGIVGSRKCKLQNEKTEFPAVFSRELDFHGSGSHFQLLITCERLI